MPLYGHNELVFSKKNVVDDSFSDLLVLDLNPGVGGSLNLASQWASPVALAGIHSLAFEHHYHCCCSYIVSLLFKSVKAPR